MNLMHTLKNASIVIIAFIGGSYLEHNTRALNRISNMASSNDAYTYCDTEQCATTWTINLYCEPKYSYLCDETTKSIRNSTTNSPKKSYGNTMHVEGQISVNEHAHNGYSIRLNWGSQAGAKGEISYDSLHGRIWNSPIGKISKNLSEKLKAEISAKGVN